jgi:glucose-6-phosphate 1-dehydrogenase
MVIFGAGGDLTGRKLIPALFSLTADRLLPAEFQVMGVNRGAASDASFAEEMRPLVSEFARVQPVRKPAWASFAHQLHYLEGDLTDPRTYDGLAHSLKELEAQRGSAYGKAGANRLFYLATPPTLYEPILEQLARSGLNQPVEGSWSRIIVEKPFGRDLASAKHLNTAVQATFPEGDVYRIDHYLGKETVQNLLVMRFANGIFEPIWNSQYVDHIQITAAETVGVEHRGGYYEGAGALRDMVQSHLMQLLTLTAMEPPVAFNSASVRDEKVKVLRSVRPIPRDDVFELTVRGQYRAGWVGGQRVPGYRQEERVGPTSRTETYAALELRVDSWRWGGVPFFLRTGKRLAKRVTEIAVQFRKVPHSLWRTRDGDPYGEGLAPNLLVLRLQPDEGISLLFGAKVPGQTMEIRPVHMDFLYGSSFAVQAPEAYERLLLDAMLGDATLFTRADEVEASWELLEPPLEVWASSRRAVPGYEAGSWGPKEADKLITRTQPYRRWRQP